MIYFKKTFSTLMIVMLIMVSIIGISSTAYSEEEFEINLNIGLNGFYKYSSTNYIPISIEVKNNSRDLNGEIQLLFQEGSIPQKKLYTAYTKELNIAKGSTKVIDMELVLESRKLDTIVRILDNKDKIVYEKNFNVNDGKSSAELGIGVLSNDIDELRYLSSINLVGSINGRLASSIVDLQENIPEKDSYLDALGIIVINNYDTEKLNNNQKEALKKWISKGGVLLVGTGPNYNRTLKGLGDIVNMNVDELGYLDNFNQVLSNSGEVFETDIALPIAQGSFNSGKDLLSYNDNVLINETQYVSGSIITTAFDLGLSPFVDWNGRLDFIKNLLSEKVNTNAASVVESQKVFNINRFFSAVQYIPKDNLPALEFVFVIIGIFILVVGPINYIVLKKLDKREKAWITIPSIVLIFTLILYFWGFGTSFKEPLINNISIIKLDNSMKKADINTVSGIIGFNKGDIDINTNENVSPTVSNSYRNSINYANFDDNDVILEYDLRKDTHIIFKERGTWDTQVINLAEIKSLDGSFTQDIKIKDSDLIGTIQNNTSIKLEDTFIVYGLDFRKLGDIEKGQSKDINFNFNKNSSSIGKTHVDKDFYMLLDSIYPWNNNNRNTANPDLLDDNAKRDILNGYLSEIYSQNNSSNILLFAWSTKPISSSIEINGKVPERIDRNLIVIPINISYEKGEQVQIPFGVLSPEIVELNGLHQEVANRTFYGKGFVVASIKCDERIEFEKIDIDITNGYPIQNYNPSIFNYQTSEWEKYNNTTISIDNSNSSQYYDENLGVRIKLEAANDAPIEVPTFSIKGVAK